MQVVQNQVPRESCRIEYFVRSQWAKRGASLEGCLSCWTASALFSGRNRWHRRDELACERYRFAAASRALTKSSRLLLSINATPVSTTAGTGEYGSAFQF